MGPEDKSSQEDYPCVWGEITLKDFFYLSGAPPPSRREGGLPQDWAVRQALAFNFPVAACICFLAGGLRIWEGDSKQINIYTATGTSRKLVQIQPKLQSKPGCCYMRGLLLFWILEVLMLHITCLLVGCEATFPASLLCHLFSPRSLVSWSN